MLLFARSSGGQGNMALATSSPSTTTSNSFLHGRRPKPWYRHITLDLLLLILANSIFHPWISLVFYLCLASIHKHREPLAYYTLYYTAFLAVVEMAVWVNHRITYGRHRQVDWETEVAVITGGGSGLGRVLAQMLVRKGAKVAVLDVKEPDVEALEEMERWDLLWETVDVSRLEDVKRALERVGDEVCLSFCLRPIFSFSPRRTDVWVVACSSPFPMRPTLLQFARSVFTP